MKRWHRRVGFVVGLLLLGAVLALAVYVQRALPETRGTVTLPGPRAELRIARDAQGIPTIRAASLEDAMFGLGYAHAQDRLWQLETHRRIAAGRLAEAFGPAALDTDRFLRALGVRRAAAAQWEQTSGETRRVVQSYTAGINAYLTHSMRARPPEFVLLGLKPEPWDPVDTLGWTIMMAWDLGGNWANELLRMRLALRLPMARVAELMPPYPGEAPKRLPDYAAVLREWQIAGASIDDRLAALAQVAPPSGLEGTGSNNWVVAGSHSATGSPLLANDPHLKLSTPALWYFARLEAPDLHVAGATMPGLPLVVLGQNEQIAWGFTNTAPDVQDLYLERIGQDDAKRYQTPEGWAPFETAKETIHVKGAPDVTMTVRRTRHGPVISDAGPATEGLTGGAGGPQYAIAMRWLALDPDPNTLTAGLAFDRARSVAEFVDASARYVAPMQNMVVADRAGHIGFVAAGRVPLRKPENDLEGLVPAPGWVRRYDWDGFLEPALTPREIDPPRGWIATANQRVTPPGYPYFLTSEWSLPYRFQRIEQLLQARPKHDVASFAAMQADVRSLATLRLLPYLQHAHATHPLAAAAQAELAAFDGTMAADRAAPLIFWAWVRQLTQGVFADELGPDLFRRAVTGRGLRDALEGVLERDDAWWCDDKSTPAVSETCAQQIDAAFQRALEELEAAYGSEVAAWRWGAVHQARAEHRPFSRVPWLARWFELREAVGGDTYTVDVSRVNLVPDAITGELYLSDQAASMRAIYDLADPARSRFMHSSGQSGLVFSGHYRDFAAPWAQVDYLPLWSAGEPEDVLMLRPPAR